MAQCMHFMKTGCNGKISQVSGFQNHLQTKSNLHILSVRTDSKNPVCHDWPCTLEFVRSFEVSKAEYQVFPLSKKNEQKICLILPSRSRILLPVCDYFIFFPVALSTSLGRKVSVVVGCWTMATRVICHNVLVGHHT